MKWDFSDTYLTILICIVILAGGGALLVVFNESYASDGYLITESPRIQSVTDYAYIPSQVPWGTVTEELHHYVNHEIFKDDSENVIRIEITMKKVIPHMQGCLVYGCEEKPEVSYYKEIYTPGDGIMDKKIITGKWIAPKDGYIEWE